MTRRSLLASLMALSLLCGGLGLASAANSTVHVDESASGAAEVYTKTGVDSLLNEYGKKTDVENNRNSITTLQTTTTDQGKQITANATNIARNTADIEKKIDTVTAEAKLALKANAADVYTKADVNTELAKKADKTYVDTEVGKKANKATTLAGYDIGDAYTKAEVDTAVANAVTTAGNNVNAKLADYAKTADVNNALKGKADKATTLAGYGITDAYTKSDVAKRLNEKADKTDLTKAQTAIDGLNAKTTKITYDAALGTSVDGVTFNAGAVTGVKSINGTEIGEKVDGTYIHQDSSIWGNMKNVDTQVGTNTTAITVLESKVGTVGTGTYLDSTKSVGENLNKLNDGLVQEVTDRKAADNALSGRIDANANTIANVNQELVNTNKHFNTELGKTNAALQSEGQARANADAALANDITATNKRTGGITRNDAANETKIEGNVTVDNLGNVTAKGQLTGKGVDAGAGAITTTGAVNAGSLIVTDASNLKGDVTMDKTLSVTGDTKLKKTDVDGTLTTTGKATFQEAVEMDKGLTVTSGDTTLKGTKVDGKLTVTDEADLKNTKVEGTLGVTGETKLDDKLTVKGEAKFEKNVTVDKDLTVTGKLNVGEISMKNDELDINGDQHDSTTTITADGISNNAKVTDRNGVTTESKFTHDKEGSTTYAKKGDATDWKEATSNVTADGVENIAKDSNGNNNTFTQTSTDTKNTLTDKEGNTSSTRQDSKGVYGYAKDKDGNKSYTKQEGNRIAESVIGQDGKETKSEMTSTDITNTAKDGTITSDAKDIVNKATGNISNSSATMDTTVTGKATESYGELETEVKGNEKHTVKGDQTNEVDGKQINTIKNGQENIISGGQTNTITGGQINNITGDQTTTITGNKKETVTENVTEDYQKDLTTTVGGNENHEVKGTKTETVEGKVTENYKAGQVTNVTGDQDITVSGTQTTTATDINRNASSGMIDTIDNDYGTNTETKVAGKTTTDVSIKGTGEKGKYIRGANESRDYLIKGTLKNSETKTVDATSTEITDGKGKTSATIQDVNNLAGSVTNGTETGVSGIHAKDNSVSIDSIVTDGNKYSVINQKKGSIQSTVVDGTNSTVILQDKDNVTIASSNGAVGIVGKDIVNNAQNTITNTAGTKITDKVGTNTRVIDSTSITDTVGTANRKVEDGKIIDTAGDFTVTTENGNGTTFAKKTGSTAYSTEVGAPTDTNIAGNLITTGRVDANELGVSDKDGDNTADFSVEAGEGKGVKASAGNGTTTGSLDVKADGIYGSATDKDGNKTYTKVTATENSFQVQDKDGKIKNHQVNTKDSSENTITNGDKTNTVTSTADGTTFNNSKANTAFEEGTYTDTTIKGNTITTGKVTMDYAEVMKDLGVHGNANITGKTTTGSLEVTGTSTLKGDVTMGSNATVNGNFNVEGNTNLKNTKVDGTLKVTQMATFDDSVSIAKDLSVDGNATIKGDVTASSYKVGDKTYIDADGIHANNQKITNVADGSISEGSKDAVNGGQLYSVKNDLEGKVNKVGANAAAMANLHPMEFDPDSKWNIAAAIGNYGSETAAALGAFYRPNDDVMVNLSTAFGTGENMVGGGVSVRLGKGGNKLSREENNALKDQVNDLTARMDALLSVLNPNMSKDFPDVPENHWAYEAVSRLAGNDIVQGYPDGEFHGERTMTRYEMAEIIYNALSRGAEAEKELVEEFKPELQAMAASEKATAERAEG